MPLKTLPQQRQANRTDGAGGRQEQPRCEATGAGRFHGQVQGKSGWVQITVEGEVFGPMAALWPGRLDRVYAVATGPAVLNNTLQTGDGYALPDQASLSVC